MGIKFVVTGFGKFQGVEENPTEVLVSDLSALLQQGLLKLHGDSEVASCTVLQVAIRGLDSWFNSIFNNLPAVLQPTDDVVVIHLGIDSRCNVPKLEARAVNNATFRCPDEAGAQPQNQMIDSSAERTLGDHLYTDLPVQLLSEALRAHGLEVEVSLDAGQFLCNLIYFSCLLRCQREGSKSWHALFVHVPPFSAYPRERQLNLLITLLNLLAIMYSRPAAATSTPGPEGQAVPPTAAGQASPGSAPTQPPQQPPQQPPLQPVAPQGVPQPPAQPPSMPAGQVTVAASPSPAPDRALAQSPGLAVLPSPAGQAGPQAVIHGMDPGAPEQP